MPATHSMHNIVRTVCFFLSEREPILKRKLFVCFSLLFFALALQETIF